MDTGCDQSPDRDWNNFTSAFLRRPQHKALGPRLDMSTAYHPETDLTGPEIIHKTTERIVQIKSHIQAARDRQKTNPITCRDMDREDKRPEAESIPICQSAAEPKRVLSSPGNREDQKQKKYPHVYPNFANPLQGGHAPRL
ncbi:hypothetical protein Tco_0747474 [Tanacetum coccineum]|uniref:Reverse transcriptase domain-containing protein n=1 Tax=Tanacetum coccineum TaxID=301880 RepID=A0ABQ4YWA8_9ASTR